jgi:hypothetical protein
MFIEVKEDFVKIVKPTPKCEHLLDDSFIFRVKCLCHSPRNFFKLLVQIVHFFVPALDEVEGIS